MQNIMQGLDDCRLADGSFLYGTFTALIGQAGMVAESRSDNEMRYEMMGCGGMSQATLPGNETINATPPCR